MNQTVQVRCRESRANLTPITAESCRVLTWQAARLTTLNDGLLSPDLQVKGWRLAEPKVSTNFFVQLFRLCASGLLRAVNAGLIQIIANNQIHVLLIPVVHRKGLPEFHWRGTCWRGCVYS